MVVGLEAMGVPLPGESLIIASAIYCATTHKLAIGWMLLAAATGAIVGDNLGYLIGRSIGYRALARYGRRFGLSDERLALGRHLFRRYGGPAVLIARFVAILRTFAALLAGANRMPWNRFLLWNAVGATLWVGVYGIAAYLAGHAIEHLEGPVAITLGVLVATAVGAIALFLKRNEQRLTEEAMREANAERRANGARV